MNRVGDPASKSSMPTSICWLYWRRRLKLKLRAECTTLFALHFELT
jgi:hypothetical protein